MRIGIDCRTILNPGFGERAGVGHYTYFLIKHLLGLDQENEYVLFFDQRFGEQAVRELIGTRPRTEIRVFPFHQYKHFLPFVYSHLLVTSFIAREKCDLFHGPGGHLPYNYRAPSVITIHDLAIMQHPEWFPERTLERFSSTRILVPKAVKTAKRIIVPSKATARDVQELFKVSDKKIRVIPHGVEAHKAEISEGIKAKYKLSNRYLLFVGTIEPRKNVAMLVRAFRKLQEDERFGDVMLAIAGAKGWKFKEVFEEIEKAGKSVRYLGYLSAEDKFALMKNATAFVFPSRYEGFGLPVLEAMQMGVPVITSNVSALPEVVGEAGLLIDSEDEAALTKAMRQALEDENLRIKLGKAGERRAKEFIWMRTAEQTLGVYKEIISA